LDLDRLNGQLISDFSFLAVLFLSSCFTTLWVTIYGVSGFCAAPKDFDPDGAGKSALRSSLSPRVVLGRAVGLNSRVRALA
jgi:hypothetical protein